jgi:hypothetical protein
MKNVQRRDDALKNRLDPNTPGALDLLDLCGIGDRYREIYHGPECERMPPWEKHAHAWRKTLTEKP